MDDDNYVNPRALLKLLKAFPQTRDVYVGRPSLNRPIRASEPRPHNRTVGPLVPSFLLPPSCVDRGRSHMGAGTPGRSHMGRGHVGAWPWPWPWQSQVGFLAFPFGILTVCLGC